MNTENQGINRRSLAKGAAWAAPAVLATATVPTYAASMCGSGPFVYRSGGLQYYFGYQYNPSSGRYESTDATKRWFTNSAGKVWVYDLPRHIEVVGISVTTWIEHRSSATTGGRGVLPINTRDNTYIATTHRATASSPLRYFLDYAASFTRVTNGAVEGNFSDIKNPGFTNKWYYSSPRSMRHPGTGQTYQAWGMTIKWDESEQNGRKTYTADDSGNEGCYSFAMELGEIYAEYRRMRAVNNVIEPVLEFSEIIVTVRDNKTGQTYNLPTFMSWGGDGKSNPRPGVLN